MRPNGTRKIEIYPAREGVFIPDAGLEPSRLRAANSILEHSLVSDSEGCLLPFGRLQDKLLGQPPLAVNITGDDIETVLDGERHGVLAATIFGPPQEKMQNEDFALAGVIKDHLGRKHAFAAVADGVTTGVFWAERASRLAAFAALKVCRTYLIQGGGYTENDIATLRDNLIGGLQNVLAADRDRLIANGTVPNDWDHDLYRRYIDRLEAWYQTTLLIALVGENGGLILWSGDGGICARKQYENGGEDRITVLRSSNDVAVENVVSLGRVIRFQGARVTNDDSICGISISLVSDGVDRTMQRLEDRRPDSFGPIPGWHTEPNSTTLTNTLDKFVTLEQKERHSKTEKVCEIDNYSAAVVRWPLLDSIGDPPMHSSPVKPPGQFARSLLEEALPPSGPSTERGSECCSPNQTKFRSAAVCLREFPQLPLHSRLSENGSKGPARRS